MRRAQTLTTLGLAAATAAVGVAAPLAGGIRQTQSGSAPSHAMGTWVPTASDTCPAELHDRYFVVGRDGKRYPTWHPPVVKNPATGRPCTFGHEHGRNPAGSRIYPRLKKLMRGVAFGVANEQLDVWRAATGKYQERHEDHVGHKIEWQNGVRLQRTVNGTRVFTGVSCDVLAKVHQGTHSPDALGNNVHEIVYAAQCSDGTFMASTVLSRFGPPNGFIRSCDKATQIVAGTAHNLPAGTGGSRLIPDRSCVEKFVLVPDGRFSQFSLGLYEDWLSANYLTTGRGRVLAYFDPHFAVFNPARYARDGQAVPTLSACSEPGAVRGRGGECTSPGPSSFDGAHREMYVNQISVRNLRGPRVWYTDPFGGGARKKSFPGAVAQFLSPTTNRTWPTLESQAFGADRPYGGRGVHSPN